MREKKEVRSIFQPWAKFHLCKKMERICISLGPLWQEKTMQFSLNESLEFIWY